MITTRRLGTLDKAAHDPARASALARMQSPPSASVDSMLTTGSLLCLLRLATTESGRLRHSDITGRSLGARRDEPQALCERGFADESAAGYTITDEGNALVRGMLTFAAKGGAR
jgi:hypothetical protein